MVAIIKFLSFICVVCSLWCPFAQASQFEAGMRALERQHYSTAMRAWLQLADEGHARAQNNIGHLFEEGLGVSQNYTTALNWYKKAAGANLPDTPPSPRGLPTVDPRGLPRDCRLGLDSSSACRHAHLRRQQRR